ncbi:MAG TPA: hypothetical protein PKD37_07420 [Oligoflexia bacterium]|nr:hypothetical protein [Oligoflexia bacterium]HMP27792.1 hypothetical protein [Oligoflexia bacterium]
MKNSKNRTLSEEEANKLVEANINWAYNVAKAVARSWNLDWQADGLDGAAMEALIFCSRRYQPDTGVPFRGYARKRIHEAAAEAARRSKTWLKSGSADRLEYEARALSAELLDVFPELRSGEISSAFASEDDSGRVDVRTAIRNLLVGASLLAAKHSLAQASPEEITDYKKMLTYAGQLEPIHQQLIWRIYWEGLSLRNLAEEWEVDELNVIREHKVLLAYLQKSFSAGKPSLKPKVRPGLKAIAVKLKRSNHTGEFAAFQNFKGEQDEQR